MQIKIAEMTESEYTGYGAGSYETHLRNKAAETERGQWLLDHCHPIDVEHYAYSENYMFAIALVGYLANDRHVVEYMLKYSRR